MRIFLVLCIIISFTACEKDDTTTPTSEDPRDIFIAAWSCQEDSQLSGTSVFEVHINKSSINSSQIILENLYNYGFSFAPYAEINSTGTGFTIPSQIIQGNSVKGEGTILGTNTINMSYTVDNGSDIDSVTAELTKK